MRIAATLVDSCGFLRLPGQRLARAAPIPRSADPAPAVGREARSPRRCHRSRRRSPVAEVVPGWRTPPRHRAAREFCSVVPRWAGEVAVLEAVAVASLRPMPGRDL